MIDRFSIIDWLMHLRAALQRALWQDLEQLERNRRMPYITSVERIGMEKGIQQSIQQGKQLGAVDQPAEIHRYEAHGIGKVKTKVKRWL
jgi:hypothetical protein